MIIKQALQIGASKLQNRQNNTAYLDAEILLAFVLKKSKEFLYTRPETELTKRQIEKFNELIKKRVKGEPIAYLTNQKEFYGLDFYVDKKVLIPRPETELLVEETLKGIRGKKLTIADIGTGSGCIIVTLAKILSETCNLKHVTYYATDISKPALTVAKKNAKKHKVKIKIYQGNLLAPLKNIKIDILLANLPYGWPEWKNKRTAETIGLKFEPPKALIMKENGLFLYRRLFEQIAKRRQKPQFIIGEFDPRQKNDLIKLAKKYLPEYQQEIKKDLAGLDRVLILKKEGCK